MTLIQIPSAATKPSRSRPSPHAMAWARGTLAQAAPEVVDDLDDLVVWRSGQKLLAMAGLRDGRRIVLKQYADDRGAATMRWLLEFAEAGLAAPAAHTVTAAWGWSPAHRTLVTDMATGPEWSSWLLASSADRDRAAVAAAEWLVRLQSLPVVLPDMTGYRAGGEFDRQLAALAWLFPSYSVRLNQLGEAVHHLLYDPRGVRPRLVPSHGDLHPGNLCLNDGDPIEVTAIDIDTAGMRRPSYDVGYALAQLLITSRMRTGSFQAGASAGLAFLRAWASRSGVDTAAVGPEMARALVQSIHFELVTYRNGRVELLDRWLDVAGAVLRHGVDDSLINLSTPKETRP